MAPSPRSRRQMSVYLLREIVTTMSLIKYVVSWLPPCNTPLIGIKVNTNPFIVMVSHISLETYSGFLRPHLRPPFPPIECHPIRHLHVAPRYLDRCQTRKYQLNRRKLIPFLD